MLGVASPGVYADLTAELRARQIGARVFPQKRGTRTELYTWLVSPEQEQQVCDALVNLGPVDTEQGLHAEGVRTIQDVLHCSLDDARAALRDLRLRNLIQETTAPIESDGPQSPLSFSWVRPPR